MTDKCEVFSLSRPGDMVPGEFHLIKTAPRNDTRSETSTRELKQPMRSDKGEIVANASDISRYKYLTPGLWQPWILMNSSPRFLYMENRNLNVDL